MQWCVHIVRWSAVLFSPVKMRDQREKMVWLYKPCLTATPHQLKSEAHKSCQEYRHACLIGCCLIYTHSAWFAHSCTSLFNHLGNLSCLFCVHVLSDFSLALIIRVLIQPVTAILYPSTRISPWLLDGTVTQLICECGILGLRSRWRPVNTNLCLFCSTLFFPFFAPLPPHRIYQPKPFRAETRSHNQTFIFS